MSTLKLFLQFSGHRPVELVEASAEAPARTVLDTAVALGAPAGGELFVADRDAPLDPDKSLHAQGVKDKDRVHVHTCRQIQVTLSFAGDTKHHPFRPSATIAEVKAWFVDKLHMSPVDATEHVLQITGTSERPDPDTQIGALVSSACALDLTLVPVKRVEG